MSTVNFPPPGGAAPERGFLDKTFGNTNIIVLVLFSFCCGWVALIFGILGLAMCKEPLAKRNATIVTGIAAVMIVANLVYYFTMMQNMPANPGGAVPVPGIPAPANP
ncbi:MAG: hypothetical protein U0800_04505 [Isosphaeraceae bacterium]